MSTNSPRTFQELSARNAIADAESHLDGFRVFLFGSARYKDKPSDIDLLFVYDPTRIAPQLAYQQLRPVFHAVSLATGCPVHPVVLSQIEEHETEFIESLDPQPVLLIDKV